MTRVVFSANGTDPAVWVTQLAKLLPDMEVVPFVVDDTRRADYAVVWAPDSGLFDRQRHLKAIFNLGAGVDALIRMHNLPAHVPVVRLGDAGMSVQMAEYVCHTVIRFTREFDRFEADMRGNRWKFRKPTQRGDFPVGVMGLGMIGARVARAVASFDMPVYGWSRSEKVIDGVQCLWGQSGFEPFLRATRILVCLLPLTADTDSILNKKNLAKLKPGSYLINVARGAHLVEEDLLTLLDSGQMAGATLDVFRQEPLPPTHPFWNHPKIVMTPHISARTLRDFTLAQIAEKIHILERGQPIEGIVDRARGY